MSTPPWIRRATVADAEAIGEVHVRSWQWAYRGLIPEAYLDGMTAELPARVERWRSILTNETTDDRTWVAVRDGRIVGFASCGPSRDGDTTPETAEVYAIYLIPEAAGQGIGRALFKHAVDDLRLHGYHRATLWVLDSNERARTFYEAAGWVPDGATKVDERPSVILREVRYQILVP